MNVGIATLCRFAAPLVLGIAAIAMVGCDDSVGGESGEGGSGGGADTTNGNGGGDPVLPQSIDALDLLLVIDGSGSMGDKQGFLAGSIRPFLERIRSPRCVDVSHAPIASQPALDAACPEGSVREYTPDVTVHVGVISSSLGSGNSDVCAQNDSMPNNDDGGHLVWRSTPGNTANDLPSYAGQGIFAWDPGRRLSPAGDSDFESFSGAVESAIRGVGELGCGYEMPLEAMYTFLNAPEPLLPDRETVDQVVLDQRAAFLRDDSVLQVILLSDENDVSFRDDAIGDFGMSPQPQPMPRPRAECASNPNDACCASCLDPVPEGCDGDGGCAAPGDFEEPGNYYSEEDPENNMNIRAWDQKRRFGIDFLLPVERYIEGLQSPTLTVGAETVPNPIFQTSSGPRKVLFTAVIGVPWQDVARDPGDPAQGFQSAEEMTTRGTWSVILGDPAANVLPSDSHMIESPDPRPGLPTSPGSDPIHGNEWDTGYKDLQYACVFDLPEEAQRQCEPGSGDNSCSDCSDLFVDKPVCDPNDQLRQIRAKAYPGRRQLQVAKALGDQALVVPLCGLGIAAAEEQPGPVGTFIMGIGLQQAAEQVATLMSGAE